MTETKYWFAGSHEEFPPSELLRQAQEAERAGFDGLGCSDHFAPWFPGGQSGNAWVYLGALGQATKLPIGTGVTPVIHRYHPGVIAQAFMSLEELFPGRVWLGAGSGDSLNETPLGPDSPQPDDALERLEGGLEGATTWKRPQMAAVYGDDIWRREEMQRMATDEVSDEEFAKEGFIVAADPGEHVERIREMDKLGPTVICLQLIGGADPHGS